MTGQPETVAGRRCADALNQFREWSSDLNVKRVLANATEVILAIENESAAAARAEAFAEIRDRVRRMPTVKVPRADFEWSGETVRAVDIAAVLALLPSVPPEET